SWNVLLHRAVPGTPLLSSFLKGESGGGPASRAGIEQTVDGCAEVAAALHTSGVTLGPPRPVGRELIALGIAAEAVRRITPTLGSWLLSALAEVDEWLAGSRPMGPRLCHGDFRHSQILFEGPARALLDLDTLCQAEPALDLGHFLAYLRLSVARGPASMQGLAEELA